MSLLNLYHLRCKILGLPTTFCTFKNIQKLYISAQFSYIQDVPFNKLHNFKSTSSKIDKILIGLLQFCYGLPHILNCFGLFSVKLILNCLFKYY